MMPERNSGVDTLVAAPAIDINSYKLPWTKSSLRFNKKQINNK